MAHAHALPQTPGPDGAAVVARLREAGLGFVYWLTFVLVLEPDNLLRAAQVGDAVRWPQEVLRLMGAGVLGALATPLLCLAVRRWPLERANWPRRVGAQALIAAVAALGLVVVSCVLAKWVARLDHRPLITALWQELAANWTLLVFAVGGLMAFVNATRFFTLAHRVSGDTAASYLSRIPVKTRGGVTLIDLAQVDWIEAQGNYLALHVGPVTHLVRESLTALAPRLDPARFVRVHRSAMVAIDRVATITSLGAGDASLVLTTGAQLRVSRSHRARLDMLIAPTANAS